MRIRILLLLVVAVVFAALSSRFLVVDKPVRSDVVLVLAGETDRRPTRGLELLKEGYATKLILDVPRDTRLYGSTQAELAANFVRQLPEAQAISICPIDGLSTKAEAQDAANCLRLAGGKSVLLVTSDFHTRRALSIFQREVPDYRFSVAASFDSRQFGLNWWSNRQWAKVNIAEWARLTWWYTIDRWT